MRVVIWTSLGPWMKLVDDYYFNADGLKSWEEFLKSVTEAKDLLLSETIQQQRLDRENNLKLRDTLKLRFGEHMMHTPNMAIFEWTDVPLKGSSCIPYKAPFVDYLDVKRCPGSHLTGVMVLTESNPRDSFSFFDFNAADISGQKSNVTSDSFIGPSANQWFENETNLKKSSRSINVIEKEVEIETKEEPKSDQSHYKDDEISMRSTKNLINITSERKSKSSKTALSAGNLNSDRTLGLLKLKLSAIRLKRKRFKKDLSPFFVVFVENDNASSYNTKNRFNDEVYRSKVIKETRNPVWDVAPISLSRLCSGYMDKKFRIAIFEEENRDKIREVGDIILCVNDLLNEAGRSGSNSSLIEGSSTIESFEDGQHERLFLTKKRTNKKRGILVVNEAMIDKTNRRSMLMGMHESKGAIGRTARNLDVKF